MESQPETTIKIKPARAAIWVPERKNGRTPALQPIEADQRRDSDHPSQTLGDTHACLSFQRRLRHARDRLYRANRDLGETAAFMAASLTTVTAIQAVISLANDKLELPKEVLRMAFNVYVVTFALIFVIGIIRAWNAIHRRAQAEHEIDETKQGILYFCPVDEWPEAKEAD